MQSRVVLDLLVRMEVWAFELEMQSRLVTLTR